MGIGPNIPADWSNQCPWCPAIVYKRNAVGENEDRSDCPDWLNDRDISVCGGCCQPYLVDPDGGRGEKLTVRMASQLPQDVMTHIVRMVVMQTARQYETERN